MTTPPDHAAASSPSPHAVGSTPRKAEAWDKVTGRAKYIDDYDFPGLLHGATIRSKVAKGRIKSVSFGEGVDWSEFTIIQAKDLPKGGKNVVKLIEDDQPYLADGKIGHKHEPVVLIAHANKETLLKGAKLVKIEVEEEKAILDYKTSETIFKRYQVKKGTIDPAVWTNPDLVVVEGEYETPHQEQTYIETQGMIARVAADGAIHVLGSLQCPFYVDAAVASLFGVARERVRVEQATTGGGFGGKEEYPSMLAGHAALLAWKSGKPVKMIYDREEDIVATTKRHPAFMKVRSACKRNGELVALDMEIAMDAGAYVTLTPVVLSRGTIHAAGPYKWENVHIRSRAAMTNTPPNGAFRGFGAPQTCFGIEAHMNRVAEALGVDPLAFRRQNVLKIGDLTATGQTLQESVSAIQSIDATKKLCDYDKIVAQAKAWNAKGGPIRLGVGVATFFHGAGFTGTGETYLASKAGIELSEDGWPSVLAASTEIGQGSATNFQQFAAEALGLPPESILVATPDTSHVPNSGPTVASRTTMVVGGLVFQAAKEMREKIEKAVGNGWKSAVEFQSKAKRYLAEHGPLRCEAGYVQPTDIAWNDETYQGSAYACYGWACVIAEMAVDLRTLEGRLLRVSTAQDVGKAIHPILCAGQVEGGTLQALGWGLLEDVVFKEGEFKNASLTNYIIPTSLDSPPMLVELIENPTKYSPLGAKGIGEMPMDGPAAAVADAVHMATNVWPTSIPATPERILALAKEQGVSLDWVG